MKKEIKKFILYKHNIYKSPHSRLLIFNKSLRIDSWFLGKTCLIYNGKNFIEKKINKQLLGFCFGELIFTRGFYIHKNTANKKKKRGKK